MAKIRIDNVTLGLFYLASFANRHTVSDWVPKKDNANFERDPFLGFAYVVNMSKMATFLGRFRIFG